MKVEFTLYNFIWFMYFTAMMNFYTYTYIQLAAQLILLAYIFARVIQNGGIAYVADIRRIRNYFLWEGLFVIWCFLTLLWAVYPLRTDTNTLLTIFRIAVMGICIVYEVNSQEKLYIILKQFIYAGAVFAVLSLITNPISSWGTTEFWSFGSGYMRNGVANICIYLIIFTFLFWEEMFSRRIRNILLLLFLIVLLICGSRRAIIVLGLAALIYILLLPDLRKTIRYIVLAVLSVAILLFIAYQIPAIRETYIDRIIQLFAGTESEDSSVVGRLAYISIGENMMKEHPLIGWGPDGFYNYLLRHPYAYSSAFSMEARHSHNNYIEIGVSYGIIGLVLFYKMHARLLLTNIRYVKNNSLSLAIVIVLTAFLIGNYGNDDFATHIPMYVLFFLFSMSDLAKEENSVSVDSD